jgi:hypothetical protein
VSADLLGLQRQVGNQAVSLVVQRREVGRDAEVGGAQDWTTRDRIDNTPRWQAACLVNLRAADSSQYRRIVERRDFYRWFYEYTAAKGFQTRWALAASIVANGAHQVADMDENHAWANDGLELAGVQLQGIMREGNQVIFDNVLPKLRDLEKGKPLTGDAALNWDMQILAEEQTLVGPLYGRMAAETRAQIDYIARQRRFTAVGAWMTGEAHVLAGPYNRDGDVPPFGQPDLQSARDRWTYGMTLGDRFTPGGSGWDRNRHQMPAAGGSYADGRELAKVDTRANLHQLDAWLNPNRLSRTGPGTDVRAIVARLTEAEKREVLTDRSPDGWAYSAQFARFSFLDEAVVRAALPAAGGPAVEAFLDRYRAAVARRRIRYPDAPVLVPY